MQNEKFEKQTAKMTQLNFVLRLRNERNLCLVIAYWLIIFLILFIAGGDYAS